MATFYRMFPRNILFTDKVMFSKKSPYLLLLQLEKNADVSKKEQK